MKKILHFILAVIMCMVFTGCPSSNTDTSLSSIVGVWQCNNVVYVFNADGSGYHNLLNIPGSHISNFEWKLTSTMLHLTYDESGNYGAGIRSYYYELENEVLSIWYEDWDFMGAFVRTSDSKDN